MAWFIRFKLHHLLFWVAYYVFWTYFSIHSYGAPFLAALLATSVYFAGQAGLGYLSIYYLLPRFFFTRRYGVFLCLVFLGIMLGALFISYSMMALFRSPFQEGVGRIGFGAYFFYAFLSVFFSTFLFIAAKVIRERVQAQRMNSALENEKTENELKFLKSQINPHFLFNAINSIYVLIRKDPDLAAATLARFSDMLRYQLYECNFREVPI